MYRIICENCGELLVIANTGVCPECGSYAYKFESVFKTKKEEGDNMSKYKYPEGADYISGFGGGYEAACQAMVIAGLEYWDENPEFNPQYRGFQGVFGLLVEDNEDAKILDGILIAAANGDSTGAMHQASVNHIFAARRLGWEEYLRQLAEHNKK